MSIYGESDAEGMDSTLTSPGGGAKPGGGVGETVANCLRAAAGGWCRVLKPASDKLGVSETAGGALMALLIATLCATAFYFSGAGEEMMAASNAAVVGRYAAVPIVMSQIDAEHYCHKEYPGGKGLASIHTEADQAAAVQACGQLDLSTTWDGKDNDGKPSGCWIGLTDNEHFPEKWAIEGQFEWTDGSPVDFARWGTGEPSNSLHGGQGEAASGEDGVTLTWVASSHPNGWWNDAHDTGFTAANGCTTCSDTQNKLAAGNYPLCQTDFPADTDINRKAQRIWKTEATAARFTAIGRIMPQTDAHAYCTSRGWSLASIHSTTDQRHAVHACSQLPLAGARPGTAHAWTTDVMADDLEWTQDPGTGAWVPQQTVLKKASGFGSGCWIGFSDNEQVTQLAGGQQSKGSFRWSDHSTVDYAAWVYGQPTGGWGDDPVGAALASGSDRNTDDHVMLTWEAGDGAGGWDDVSNDVIDTRTTGLGTAGSGTETTWMAKGAYPLCQTAEPTAADGMGGGLPSWEMETETMWSPPGGRTPPAYYIALGKIIPQTSAQTVCTQAPFFGHLASVHSMAEGQMLKDLCQTMSLSHTWEGTDHPGFANSCWIGLTDNELHTSSLTQASEGNFVWTDGTLVDYLDWHPGEPSNNIRADSGAGGEDAVAITFIGDFNGQWNDIHDIGYNRKSGCTSCATNEEAVWGSYPICKAGPGYVPGSARNYGGR